VSRSSQLALVSAVAVCGGCGSPAPLSYGYLVPGPGNQVDIAFDDDGQNFTPAHAAPLGTSTTSDVTVWVGENTIGGAHPSSYYVFKSGPAAGTFAFDGCFSAPITSMTASLWKVTDVDQHAEQQTPPVGTWASTPDGASGCFASSTAPMEASTIYLFGLTALGGAGTYSL
jgi:hypothetical protein